MNGRIELIRALALYGPILVVWVLWRYRRRSPRDGAALVVGMAWQLGTLPLLNQLAVHMDWWTFRATPYHCLGVPLELFVGWAVLWGAVPAVIRQGPLVVWVVLMGWFDLVAMPYFEPLTLLGERWLVGEAVLLVAGFLPGLCLIRWTQRGTQPGLRGAGQTLSFALILFVILPHAAGMPAPSYSPLFMALYSLALIVVSLPGLAAVHAFADYGEGTPLPLDPPQGLVTQGIYAYCRNPMQVSMLLAVVVVGCFFQSALSVLVGFSLTLSYSFGFAAWSEDHDLSERFGDAWKTYRDQVPAWWPRRR